MNWKPVAPGQSPEDWLMDQYSLTRVTKPAVRELPLWCSWCEHSWHGWRCLSCRCTSAEGRLDDTWRPLLDRSQHKDAARMLSHNTGIDGYTATYCVQIDHQKPGLGLRLRNALNGK